MRPIKGGVIAANRTMQLLRAMWNACGKGLNPATGIRKEQEHACDRYLTAEEFPLFWAALHGQGELMQDLLKFAMFTAQRRSTLITAKWDEINLPFKTWTIPAAKMKAGKSHVVPLIPQAMELLKQRRKTDPTGEWIFSSAQADTGHVDNPQKALATIAKTAGILPITLHDLRRTTATWMNSTGASESTIAALLAHSYRNVTGVYAKATADTVRMALERAVAAMMTATGPSEAKAKAG
jgi:integrase